MRSVMRVLVSVLVVSLLSPGVSLAQQVPHVADASTLDQLIVGQSRQDEADRRAIREVLRRDEVREVARHAGLDLARAELAVSTLSGAELQEIADHARQVNQALSGGASTIVISTTTIVIVLLLVLLIVLAIN